MNKKLNTLLQQDGVRSNYRSQFGQALNAGFPKGRTGRSQSITWPLRSSTVTPLTLCHVVALYVNNTVHTDKIRDMLRDRTYAFVLTVFPDKLGRPWD
jgi:hypothetical protein